ncbi:MAG TPA: acetyl-CoA carboxylase carboxyl transferase subunit alpha [Verrucomicrobiales bacterium]|jgi:acetyl-CoA carboxylase carboxyl transferase subunit alpha|nr:acetyl-CoA carboxylase carboxyl transferase subunit alpha [Deltaproteobacteria bacterium]HAT20246.1 acetyl-CoA carboxylase carboxyl transferase subunit alpha [Verrucomicrobiales bacterium]
MNDSSGRPQPLDFEKPIAELEGELEDMREKACSQEIDLSAEIAALEVKLAGVRNRIYENLTPWQRVQIARHISRPFMLDYLNEAFDDFCELHGDRLVGDDQAMPGGFALLDGRRCVVIGHQKGRDTKENLERNFGSAHPEGYRKALRLMKLAEKFRIPVVSLIDTPGAFPGIGAEERNIAEAIARNLREMMSLRTPIVVAVIGEGGSGGALGVGVADRILMLENAYYSVISPEGCAAILWKHRKHAPEAAKAMKLTAEDLVGMSLIDEVVPEPTGGAHHDVRSATGNLKAALVSHIDELEALSEEEMLNARYEKFRRAGQWAE